MKTKQQILITGLLILISVLGATQTWVISETFTQTT